MSEVKVVADSGEKLEENLAVSEEELVDSVQAKLDVMNGDDSGDKDDDDEQTEEQKSETDSTPEAKKEKEAKADDDEDEGDSTSVEAEAKTDTEEGQEVTLPDAYYRAAVHQGWTPEEVKEFFEATPELAVKSFAKMYESTNKLSSEFARIGRLKLTPDGKTQTATEATEATEAKKAAGTDSDDVAALKEQYGEDSPVVKAFSSMQAQLDTAEANRRPTQEEIVEPSPEAKVAVDQFFADPTLKPYADFYGEGKDADKLTHGQMKHRWEMLEMADVIIRGAVAQGLDMEFGEAMEKAHMLVSDSVREKAIRSDLKAKIVKRGKGLTLKPSSSKKAVADKDGPKSSEQLEAEVGATLSKIYKR